MKTDIHEELEIPEKVSAALDSGLHIKGPRGEVSREFHDPKIMLSIKEGKIVLESHKGTKREKTLLYTFAAHIKNMLKGVTEPHFYELKICAAHFPMNVAVSGKEFIVKNFLGENTPRRLALRDGVSVKVNGNIVRIESCDVELAGMTASEIELLTRIRNRDRRVFQDGIYIINKDGDVVQ